MDKHKIIFSVLVVILFITCLTSVYSSTSQNSDYTICIDNIKFNTTFDSNINQFQLYNDTDFDDGTYEKQYVDQNHVGYNVFIWNISTGDDWDDFSNHVKKSYENISYETINGVQVYNVTAGQGDYAGAPRFESYIINDDLKTIVQFSTPTPEDTVKIALSLEFR